MYLSGIADEAAPDIDGQITAHQELGWEHIELRCVDGVNFTQVDDAVFEACAEKLAAAKMQVSCFGSAIANWARPISKDLEDDIQDLERSIPRMQKLGTRFIRIMSYPNDGWKVADWRAEATRRLRELSSRAEAAGVVLVMENCSGYFGEYPVQVTELFESIDSPALKVVYDTGNPVGHVHKALDMYQACKPHIAYVHVKDFVRDGVETTPCYPGEGAGQVRETLQDLLASGYDGGISIEPHMAGQIHLGEDASQGGEAKAIYQEYGRRLEKIIAELRAAAS